MQKLLDIFPYLLEIAPDEPEVRKAIIASVWRAVAGPQVSANAAVHKVSHKILRLAVRDESWKRELGALAPQLIGKINGILQRRAIERIELFVDASVAFGGLAGVVSQQVNENSGPPPKTLSEAAKAIRDDALRSAFLSAAAGSLSYKRKYGR